MLSDTLNILGIRISRLGFLQALNICLIRGRERKGGYVCFANVHSVTDAQSKPLVREALNDAFMSVADGVPLVWTSRLKRAAIASRVCGPDFMRACLEQTKDDLHGFIGGSPGQAEALAETNGLKAICHSPPIRPFSRENALEDWEKFLDLCPERKPPAFVWIGLGAPKQELWMKAVSSSAPETLFFGVGAAFDFLTGTKKRAPDWMQRSGLEWLYRLCQEPGRLWKRYLVNNLLYLLFILTEDLSFVLALQLVLTLLIPPLKHDGRSVFLGDLCFFLWVPIISWGFLIRDPKRGRAMIKTIAIAAIIFLATFIHGKFRASIVEELKTVDLFLTETDAFNPVREVIVAFRFLIWFWAGTLVAFHPFDRKDLSRLFQYFTAIIGAISAVMILAWMSPALQSFLGRVYGYDPKAFPWDGRAYGVFRSPIEAGISLGFAAMILVVDQRRRSFVHWLTIAATIVGVALSGTLSAVVAWVAAGAIVLFARSSGFIRTAVLIASIGVSTLFFTLSSFASFSHGKLVDFLYRFGPWKVYLKTATTRWDFMIFGSGYANQHVDNSYLFLLNRGGILLLGFIVFALGRPILRFWHRWSWHQKMVVVYFLTSGLTIDSIILRPMVALVMCVAIPILTAVHEEPLT